MADTPKRITLDQEPIWEMQFDETLTQYRAFALYRDLLGGRTLAKVAQMWSKIDLGDGDIKLPKAGKAGAPLSRLSQWSSTNRWVERADAYELYLEQQRREERETEIGRMERREKQLGTVGVSGVMRRVIGYDDPEDPTKSVEPIDWSKLTPSEVAQLARTFVEISRLSTNRPTSLVKSALMINPRDYEDAMNGVIELAMKYVPDDRKTSFAEQVNAFLHTGER